VPSAGTIAASELRFDSELPVLGLDGANAARVACVSDRTPEPDSRSPSAPWSRSAWFISSCQAGFRSCTLSPHLQASDAGPRSGGVALYVLMAFQSRQKPLPAIDTSALSLSSSTVVSAGLAA